MLDLTTIKKDLYKSKAMANFSHYCAGNIYYTVMIEGSKHQFPMETIDYTLEKQNIWPEGGAGIGEVQFKIDNITLSADLGTTAFGAEIKAAELIRWIGKALEKGELIKVG